MPYDRLRRIRMRGGVPRHVAVIMDGNGRGHAVAHGRHSGHREGVQAVREVVEGALDAGIEILTLFACSTDEGRRSGREVAALMGLLQRYALRERDALRERGVEVHVLGDLDGLDPSIRDAIATIVEGTRGGDALRLNLMISYGGREELVHAARTLMDRVRRGELDPRLIDDDIVEDALFTRGLPHPDLLIRSSGDFRISNFMLWQIAYTELHVTPVVWPRFRREHLFDAVLDFQGRERRYGRVHSS